MLLVYLFHIIRGFYFYNLLYAIDCANYDKINELINKSLSKDGGLLLEPARLAIYLKKHLGYFGKISPTLNEEDTNKHLEFIEKLHGIIKSRVYSTPSILTHFVKTGNFDAVKRIFAVASVDHNREKLLSLTREACKAPYNDNSKKILLALFDNSETMKYSEERQELREKIMFWALRNGDQELAKKAFDSLVPTLDVSLRPFAVSNDIEIAIIKAIRSSWLDRNKGSRDDLQLLQSLKDIILEPLPRGTDDLSDTSFIKNFDILRKMAIVGFKNPLNFWVPSNSEEERAFKINKDHLDDLFKVGELLRKKKQPLTNEQILTSPLITQKAIFEDIRNHTTTEIGLFRIKSRHAVIAKRIYFQVSPRLKFAATSAIGARRGQDPGAQAGADDLFNIGVGDAWAVPGGTSPAHGARAGAGAGARARAGAYEKRQQVPPASRKPGYDALLAPNSGEDTFSTFIENPYHPYKSKSPATPAIEAKRKPDLATRARLAGLLGDRGAWAVPEGTSPAHGARAGAGIGGGEEVPNPVFSPTPPAPLVPDAARKPGGAAVVKPPSDKDTLPTVTRNPLSEAGKLVQAEGPKI